MDNSIKSFREILEKVQTIKSLDVKSMQVFSQLHQTELRKSMEGFREAHRK